MYLLKQVCVNENENLFTASFNSEGDFSRFLISVEVSRCTCSCLLEVLIWSFIEQNDSFCHKMFEQITNMMTQKGITGINTNKFSQLSLIHSRS